MSENKTNWMVLLGLIFVLGALVFNAPVIHIFNILFSFDGQKLLSNTILSISSILGLYAISMVIISLFNLMKEKENKKEKRKKK